MFQRLRQRLDLWLIGKLVVAGFNRLESEHLGQKLKVVLDGKFGEKALVMQRELAKWLRNVASELEG